MSSALCTLCLLALAIATSLVSSAPAPTPTQEVVSMKVANRRLSSEALAALNKKRIAANPSLRSLLEDKDPVIHLKSKNDATGQSAITLSDFYQYALIGNISVGTPAQNFSVMFDLWSSDMSLVDVGASFDTEYCDSSSGCSDENNALALKNTYNASASSSATKSSKKFRGSFEAGDKGTITKDTVNLNGLTSTMSFGDLTQVGYYLDMLPIDGTMGISAAKSNNKIDNVLKQLVGSLTNPVMTLHVNRSLTDYSSWPNTDAEIMFGSNALPQCNSTNWVTYNLAPKPSFELSYGNLTSVSVTDPTQVNGQCDNAVVATTHPLVIVDYFTMTRVSVQAMNVFKKASGAVYDSKYGWFTVDCSQLDTLPTVTIGLDGGVNIVMQARDYVLDLSSTDGACFLFVRGAYDEDDKSYQQVPIVLGQTWLNRHCISYDINANTLSFTDALPNNGQ